METKIGRISWHDLTVNDAETVSEFYKAVVGWEKQPLSMGDYDDYVMTAPGTDDATGICHARGKNKDIPPQWLIYIQVENLDASLEECKRLGGKVMGDKRNMGEYGIYCLIQDPAGAHAMLF